MAGWQQCYRACGFINDHEWFCGLAHDLMDGFGCVWWVCGELFAATMVFVVFGPLGKLLTLSFYTI
jgi:hypothetical protein